MKNELIIFDCFGVIFGEIAPVIFERYFSPDKARELKEKYFVPADLGEVTLDEIFDGMADEIGISKERLIKEWNELIILNKEIVPVIEKLKEEYTIILLSNAPLGFVEKLMSDYKLEYLFDKIFISCNLKMSKPNPAIYKYCVDSFENNFDMVYMIDDNLKNLEPLPSLGITPVHFTSIEKMIETLK